jgi:hypothetical protein
MCTKCRWKFVCDASSTLASPRQACPLVWGCYGYARCIAYRKEYDPLPHTAFLRRYWQQRRGLRAHLIMLVLAALLPLVLFLRLHGPRIRPRGASYHRAWHAGNCTGAGTRDGPRGRRGASDPGDPSNTVDGMDGSVTGAGSSRRCSPASVSLARRWRWPRAQHLGDGVGGRAEQTHCQANQGACSGHAGPEPGVARGHRYLMCGAGSAGG